MSDFGTSTAFRCELSSYGIAIVGCFVTTVVVVTGDFSGAKYHHLSGQLLPYPEDLSDDNLEQDLA